MNSYKIIFLDVGICRLGFVVLVQDQHTERSSSIKHTYFDYKLKLSRVRGIKEDTFTYVFVLAVQIIVVVLMRTGGLDNQGIGRFFYFAAKIN